MWMWSVTFPLNCIGKRLTVIVSGSEEGCDEYYLLLFSDILTRSIMLVEQIFCGYEMFTQEQINDFF